MNLLTNSSAKLDKSQNDEWLNALLYLDPNYNSEVCKGRSKGCAKHCLIYSGRMVMSNAVNARAERTRLYFEENELFIMQLKGEIAGLLAKAKKQGKRLAIRLNGTSDIDWTNVYKSFPMVQFYEYTKRPYLASVLLDLENVHITLSKHEKMSWEKVQTVLNQGINVAVVFDKVPETFKGIPVVNGDLHDRRFEDTKGMLVGLKGKGNIKSDTTGFMVRVEA